MTMRTALISVTALALGIALGAIADRALSDQHLKVTPLLKRELADLPGREVRMVLLEVKDGAEFPPHTHPGTEIVYQLEGSATLSFPGEPVKTTKPGQAVLIPAGQEHSAKVAPGKARAVIVRIHKTGEPVRTPVK